MSDDTRELARILASVEEMAVDPDAPHDLLNKVSTTVGGMMAEAGLDPADGNHRRAFVMGYVAGMRKWGGDSTLVCAGALRPPVVPR